MWKKNRLLPMDRHLVQCQKANRLPKDEPQSRSENVKEEVTTPKSEPTALEPKEESDEQDADDQNSDTLREELQRSRDAFPPHDSEDSLGPEHVADELRRLTEAHAQMTGSTSIQESRGGATAPDPTWDNQGPYAPQRSRRNRGRPMSPDPLMFRSTIWVEHDQEASARAHEEPIEQLRDRARTMEHNLETLRTRLTQVADLRDAQGIREDHRALVTRLTEVEECGFSTYSSRVHV